MPPLSRTLACLALVLALSAPAYAANDSAPGALKKDATTVVEATAPATPIATQPTPASQAAPKADTKSAPVTKGTVKKLTQTQTTATPVAESTTGTTHTTKRGATKRRLTATRVGPALRHRTASRRANTRARRHALPVRARGRANVGRTIAANAPYAAPGQTRAASPTPAVKPKPKTKPKPKVKSSSAPDVPLASISQVANHVVEVIPGAVILALAGLVCLVMMLILRSLTVERQRGKALSKSYGVTVEALATAIEAKDLTTGGHIERVRRLGLLLAEEIVPRETGDPQMAYGFLLHDIGKLAVPDAILCAPGRLTEEQWTLMRRHPDEGVRMLSDVPFLDRALDVVRYHHERWDGGGYPAGLEGEQIPVWARIFAVVDALDAMTAERPYRAARSYEAALAEIRRHSGTQFDPMVVEALGRLEPADLLPLLEPPRLVEPLAELPHVEPLAVA